MSIQFGFIHPEGRSAVKPELRTIARATDRYAKDGCALKVHGRAGMGFQPFHTHVRSGLGEQPMVTDSGDLLTLDGRIDNYEDLCASLDLCSSLVSDPEIVYAAYLKWGTDCFSKLVGDWALALWSPIDQVLYLARDHAGTRTLYYSMFAGEVHWSTYIESLFITRRDRELDLDYAARYLSALPIRDTTPYRGIIAITPGHCLVIRDSVAKSFAHWWWSGRSRIYYQEDREYESHFFSLFRQSVERRTGPGSPILAQLSGGMDSSSIVCMSDSLRAKEGGGELLDTVSLYDDEEETWNERPFFSAVETFRGKTGLHFNASFLQRTYQPLSPEADPYLFPGGDQSSRSRERAFLESLGSRDFRVILSGIGGDEVTGGVPTPFPELANALASLNVRSFAARAFEWSLAGRCPVIWLIADTLKEIWRLYLGQTCVPPQPLPAWLTPDTHRRIRDICNAGDQLLEASFGEQPDSIINRRCLWSVLEGLPHQTPALLKRFEYRYPYLDRDLLEFLFRIPRNQLVRPGQRRSLMRRSLANLLPAKVLERRSKAFVRQGPVASLRRNCLHLMAMLEDSLAAKHGLIDGHRLSRELASFAEGRETQRWPQILRAILFEIWLRSVMLRHPGSAALDATSLRRGSTAAKAPAGFGEARLVE